MALIYTAFAVVVVSLLAVLLLAPPLPQEAVDAVAYLFSQAQAWDAVVPIGELIAALLAMTVLHGAYHIWRATRWLAGLLRGSGS